jgi:hypothetical protein
MNTSLGGGVGEATGLGRGISVDVRLLSRLTIIRCAIRENKTA